MDVDFLGNKKTKSDQTSSKKDDDYEIVWSAPRAAQPAQTGPVQAKAPVQNGASLSSHFFTRVAEKQKEKQEVKNNNHNSQYHSSIPARSEIIRSAPISADKPLVAPANFLKENIEEAKKEGFVRPEFNFDNKKTEPLVQTLAKTQSKVQRLENSFWRHVKKFFSNLFFANKKVHPLPQSKKVEETIGEEINNPKILETNLIKQEAGAILGLGRKIVWPALGLLIPLGVIAGAYLTLHLQIEQRKKIVEQLADQISVNEIEVVKAQTDAKPAISFKKRLSVVNSLLNKHVYWTNFFHWLETNTLAEVSYLQGFSGDLTGEYTLLARAQNYALIEKQVAQLSNVKETVAISVKSAKTSFAVKDAAPGVVFDLDLTVKSVIFYKP